MVDASSPKRLRLSSSSSTAPSSTASAPQSQATLASIFVPKQQNKEYKWLPPLGSGSGPGCGHFVWGDPSGSSKVAAFDIDGTVIEPKEGRKFPRDETDWQFLYPNVVRKIREAHATGFAIVLISNQAGQPKQQEKFKRKMPLLCKNINVPLHVFAAWSYDNYRKSATGMWDAYVEEFNGGKTIDYSQSFYVGDAAGRDGDHNDTDRKMAMNCGLRFYTPEEWFLDKPARPYTLRGWNAGQHDHTLPLYSPTSTPLLPHRLSEFDSHPPEVVLFVGFPGSGKTSFYKRHFAASGYVHVNQDTLKTRPKCLDKVAECLSAKPPVSCVVDNTSPSASVRKEYLTLIRSRFKGVKVRCFWFSAPMELAMHNSVYRAAYAPIDKGNAKKREVLPLIAFNSYAKNFQQPKLEEGFDEVKQINFRFDGPPEELSRWSRWLADIYPRPKAKKNSLSVSRLFLADFSPSPTQLCKELTNTLEVEGWDESVIEAVKAFRTSGKIVLVGDAVHALSPLSFQGGSQAIEDGASLAVCHALSGGKPEDIPRAFKAFGIMRKDRVAEAQIRGTKQRHLWAAREVGKVKTRLLPLMLTPFRVPSSPYEPGL
ncbi:hypothetical protein JCM8547_002572 [Rhodosporidiobolus lusitaniae]